MNAARMFLVTQSGKKLALLEARDKESALNRAKGLGDVLDFSPSFFIEVVETSEAYDDLPSFYNDYFEMMGFTR